jgi:hypothetical protein
VQEIGYLAKRRSSDRSVAIGAVTVLLFAVLGNCAFAAYTFVHYWYLPPGEHTADFAEAFGFFLEQCMFALMVMGFGTIVLIFAWRRWKWWAIGWVSLALSVAPIFFCEAIRSWIVARHGLTFHE